MKLNGATIPDNIVDRVVRRSGGEHCFADLDPAHTALVVIDLQHAFMDEAVDFAVVPSAIDIVPAVNRLAAALRQSGGGGCGSGAYCWNGTWHSIPADPCR